MLEGIDVSNFQRTIDWAAVAGAGKRFAFIKATEGTFFRDPLFYNHYDAAMNQQLWRGAYHFARPGRGLTGADEAGFFCDFVLQVPQVVGDLYIIDLEYDRSQPALGSDLGAYLLDWCQTVEGRMGVKPLIYSSVYDLTSWCCTGRDDLAAYGLWLASWSDAPPLPPPNWPVWAFWQYSDSGTVAGVNGPCDLDRFNGSEDDLAKYGVPA